MKIKLSSIFVNNQSKALKFYTEVLGFNKSKEIPVGEFKWLTVISPDGPAGIELVLEPNANPAAKQYQESIFKQGIPITAFEVDDIQTEYERLKDQVIFTMAPTRSALDPKWELTGPASSTSAPAWTYALTKVLST
jgi:catechol 2,3-dioxygenase-like lactoylglutathione lyase family enzyme